MSIIKSICFRCDNATNYILYIIHIMVSMQHKYNKIKKYLEIIIEGNKMQ